MKAIADFLQAIGNAIVAAIDFVVGFFQDIVYIIQLTGKVLAQIPSYFSWLPAELLAIILTIFAVVVIYKILGREG